MEFAYVRTALKRLNLNCDFTAVAFGREQLFRGQVDADESARKLQREGIVGDDPMIFLQGMDNSVMVNVSPRHSTNPSVFHSL